jgi:hypothetical protein
MSDFISWQFWTLPWAVCLRPITCFNIINNYFQKTPFSGLHTSPWLLHCLTDYHEIFFFNFLFCLSVFLPFCLSVFLTFCLSVFLSFCVSVFLSFCHSVFLSFCLSVVQSFCLSVFCFISVFFMFSGSICFLLSLYLFFYFCIYFSVSISVFLWSQYLQVHN